MENMINKEKGITLVTLVITILIIIFLTGISIRSVINMGIVEKTTTGSQEYTRKGEAENTTLKQTANVIDDTLDRLKNLENNEELLPSEYRQIEYIESTGTQWINTGVKSDNNFLKFEIKYSLTKLPESGKYIAIFGAYTNENSNATRMIYYGGSSTSGPKVYTYINNKAGSSAITDPTVRRVNVVYTEVLEKNNNFITYSSNAFENLKTQSNIVNGSSFSGNIAIFSQKDSGSICSSMRLYYFNIYDNQKLIRKFIPCYNIVNKTTGLYELVEGKFYTNAGEGEFIWDN